MRWPNIYETSSCPGEKHMADKIEYLRGLIREQGFVCCMVGSLSQLAGYFGYVATTITLPQQVDDMDPIRGYYRVPNITGSLKNTGYQLFVPKWAQAFLDDFKLKDVWKRNLLHIGWLGEDQRNAICELMQVADPESLEAYIRAHLCPCNPDGRGGMALCLVCHGEGLKPL